MRLVKTTGQLAHMFFKDQDENVLLEVGQAFKNFKKFEVKLNENERIIGMKYNKVNNDPKRKKDIQFIIGSAQS